MMTSGLADPCTPRTQRFRMSLLSDVFGTFDECAFTAVGNVDQRYHTHRLWLADTAAQQKALLYARRKKK